MTLVSLKYVFCDLSYEIRDAIYSSCFMVSLRMLLFASNSFRHPSHLSICWGDLGRTWGNHSSHHSVWQFQITLINLYVFVFVKERGFVIHLGEERFTFALHLPTSQGFASNSCDSRMGVLLERKKKKSIGGDRGWPEDGRVDTKWEDGRRGGKQDGRVIELERRG